METTKPRTVSSIGMFDMLKGAGMLAIVLGHTVELYPLQLSNGLSLTAFFCFIYRETLMAAFFIASGYGFRKRSIHKCIHQQLISLLKPFCYTAVFTTVLHFIIHYKTFHYLPGSLTESIKVAGGFLLGLPHTATYFGQEFFSCGPMWYLLALLVGTMLFMALIVSHFIMFIYLRHNPYPLVFRCLKESGLTAFFTRSSAANIPVNMSLCEKLGLDKDMYSVSIPLGATINMDGAAITITIMTLAAANTLGIQVSLPAAIVLSAMSALGACGASGVAGGSLLLIPMACSLFGISNDIAMQMVGVGFIIGVVQDSVETALNSAGDVEFAATAEYHQWRKAGKPLPEFLG